MYHIQTTNSHKQPKHTPKNLKTHKTQTQESQKAQKIDLQYTKSTNLKFGLQYIEWTKQTINRNGQSENLTKWTKKGHNKHNR